jgi:hypothetical protein
VARVFTHEKDVDYHETFAPTVRVISIRTLLALDAYVREVEQLDVVMAFLDADMEVQTCMGKPEGFRHTDINRDKRVCLLTKSLYGLKQDPWNWSKTTTAWLEEYGFSQSKVDPPGIHVFIKDGELYVLMLYVDDNIIVGPVRSFIAWFKSAFDVRFNVQDPGPMYWLLGMTVERDRGNRIIRIGQQQYVLDILERFNMVDCRPVGSPMAVDALSTCVETSTSKLPPG